MSVIKRILRFDRRDWQHIFWLAGRIVNGALTFNMDKTTDAWYWLIFHFSYDSKRLN
jgi:hypothetical protein